MPEHEEKRCPRCNTVFTCCVGSITLCQCTSVKLDAAQRQYLSERHDDCLCAACMVEERRVFNINRFKARIQRLIGR